MFKAGITAFSVLLFITGCTPHPGTGLWLSPGANTDAITKVEVDFDRNVRIYSTASAEPALQCRWRIIDTQNLKLDCVYLINTELKEKYRLIVTGNDTAELYRANRFITKLIKHTVQPNAR